VEKRKNRKTRDVFARELHWWDEHPPANPETEPVYAEALRRFVSELA
jgi:hypothetical protein